MTEYHLTDAGRDVQRVIDAMGSWGVQWAFDEPSLEEMDAGLVVWKVHQRVDRALLPDRRTVVEFDFTGVKPQRLWMVLEPAEVSVCVTPPRFESDLVIRTSLAYFLKVWLGYVDWESAVRCGALVVEGPPALAKQFPRWLQWSAMARFVREREQNRKGAPIPQRA